MLFAQKDWKEQLAKEDEEKLNELVRRTLAYRDAYGTAEDVRAAQLWCAVLELKKEHDAMDDRLVRIERILETMLPFSKEKKDLRDSLSTF